MAIGGTAGTTASQMGGIVGSVLPHASTWEFLVIGALAAAAAKAPEALRAAADAIFAERQKKRSSIAYIAEFK